MKPIRGLPDHLAEISRDVASDLESDSPEAQARIAMLREALPEETYRVLQHAVRGIGPRQMQQRYRQTTAYWQKRLDGALRLATYHYKTFMQDLGNKS